VRKIKYTDKKNSLLKSGLENIKTISNAQISYIQKKSLKPLQLSVWAKFDEVNFDGISVLANISDGWNNKTIGNCVVDIYSIDQGNSWNENFLVSKNGVLTPNGMVVDFSSSEIIDLEGDITLKIAVRANRQNSQFYFKGYFNHLGSIELMNRNKRRISFLEITKVDE